MGLRYSDVNKIQTLYNLSIYEKSCKKFNKNYKKSLYSWDIKKILDDYIKKNNGDINRLFLYMPSQLRTYLIYSEEKFSWKRFLKYNINVFLKRFPIVNIHREWQKGNS